MNYHSKRLREFTTTKAKVRALLEEFPDSRNDDTLLICLYLEKCESLTTVRGIRINSKRINFESIRRGRQLIQQKGDLLPTDETVRRRRGLQPLYEALAAQNKRELQGK
jgi:hypothetical protein